MCVGYTDVTPSLDGCRVPPAVWQKALFINFVGTHEVILVNAFEHSYVHLLCTFNDASVKNRHTLCQHCAGGIKRWRSGVETRLSVQHTAGARTCLVPEQRVWVTAHDDVQTMHPLSNVNVESEAAVTQQNDLIYSLLRQTVDFSLYRGNLVLKYQVCNALWNILRLSVSDSTLMTSVESPQQPANHSMDV